MDVILFGRQGSGKGTQGKLIAERYGLMPFVTGDELRKLAKEDSELGRKIKSIIEAGHLVPNEVVMEIIANFMQNIPAGKSVLFDGIPRKMEQADSMEALLQEMDRDFIGLQIEIAEDTAIERLTSRRVCAECKSVYPGFFKGDACESCGGELITRQDDSNMDSIQNRLTAYREETLPVIEAYQAKDKIIEIDGEPDITVVSEAVFTALDPYFKSE
jgi:adenylate kinase